MGEQDFDVLTEITNVEIIAVGNGIRDLRRLIESLRSGRIHRAELHWYEAHGIGRRDLKVKRYIE